MMSHDKPRTYIWLLNGEPCTGDVKKYSYHWMYQYYDGDQLSDTVLSWAPGEDPITWDVTVVEYDRLEGHIGYRITIDGASVHVAVKEEKETS